MFNVYFFQEKLLGLKYQIIFKLQGWFKMQIRIARRFLVVLTLIGMRGDTFISWFLDQILSAEFLSKISKLFWRWKLTSISSLSLIKNAPKCKDFSIEGVFFLWASLGFKKEEDNRNKLSNLKGNYFYAYLLLLRKTTGMAPFICAE